MVQSQILVNVVDNSSVRLVKCIGINNRSNRGFIKLGGIFSAVILRLKSRLKKKTFKKGSLVNCLLLYSQKENQHSSSGIFIKHLGKSAGVIVSSSPRGFVPLSSRFDGFFPLACYNSAFSFSSFNFFIKFNL